MEFKSNKSKSELYISFYGDQLWFQNGLYCRTNGPAYISHQGIRFWYKKTNFIGQMDLPEFIQMALWNGGKMVIFIG